MTRTMQLFLVLVAVACAHVKPERECSKACAEYKTPLSIPPPAWDKCMDDCLAKVESE